jgi:type IV pilus assembly protein PilA
VLVAISIPIFTSQLEKSREATDAANIRSAYAEVVAAAITDDGNAHTATVKLKQQQDDWQTTGIDIASGEITTTESAVNGATITGVPKKNGSAVVTYTPASGSTAANVTIAFSS